MLEEVFKEIVEYFHRRTEANYARHTGNDKGHVNTEASNHDGRLRAKPGYKATTEHRHRQFCRSELTVEHKQVTEVLSRTAEGADQCPNKFVRVVTHAPIIRRYLGFQQSQFISTCNPTTPRLYL